MTQVQIFPSPLLPLLAAASAVEEGTGSAAFLELMSPGPETGTGEDMAEMTAVLVIAPPIGAPTWTDLDPASGKVAHDAAPMAETDQAAAPMPQIPATPAQLVAHSARPTPWISQPTGSTALKITSEEKAETAPEQEQRPVASPDASGGSMVWHDFPDATNSDFPSAPHKVLQTEPDRFSAAPAVQSDRTLQPTEQLHWTAPAASSHPDRPVAPPADPLPGLDLAPVAESLPELKVRIPSSPVPETAPANIRTAAQIETPEERSLSGLGLAGNHPADRPTDADERSAPEVLGSVISKPEVLVGPDRDRVAAANPAPLAKKGSVPLQRPAPDQSAVGPSQPIPSAAKASAIPLNGVMTVPMLPERAMVPAEAPAAPLMPREERLIRSLWPAETTGRNEVQWQPASTDFAAALPMPVDPEPPAGPEIEPPEAPRPQKDPALATAKAERIAQAPKPEVFATAQFASVPQPTVPGLLLQASAPLPQAAATKESSPPPPVHVQIAQALSSVGTPVTELRLSPEELGHVKIDMRREGERLVMTITAERQDTLDLLRRHGGELAAELRAAGHSGLDLSFGRWSGPGTEGRGEALPDPSAPPPAASRDDPAVPASSPAPDMAFAPQGSGLYLRI